MGDIGKKPKKRKTISGKWRIFGFGRDFTVYSVSGNKHVVIKKYNKVFDTFEKARKVAEEQMETYRDISQKANTPSHIYTHFTIEPDGRFGILHIVERVEPVGRKYIQGDKLIIKRVPLKTMLDSVPYIVQHIIESHKRGYNLDPHPANWGIDKDNKIVYIDMHKLEKTEKKLPEQFATFAISARALYKRSWKRIIKKFEEEIETKLGKEVANKFLEELDKKIKTYLFLRQK